MSESTEFRWENETKLNQDVHFFSFNSKNHCLKRKTRNFIFYYKNRNTYLFHALTVKNGFGNMSENDEFKFENKINCIKKNEQCL